MITPQEAFTQGMEAVELAAASLPRRKRGTAAERIEAALAVAAFLVENEVEEGVEAGSDGFSLDGAVPTGPARKVACMAAPGDFAYVRGGKSGPTPFVALEVVADGEPAQVALSVKDARAYAAGILDAADEAEGGSPLLWNFGTGEEPPAEGVSA